MIRMETVNGMGKFDQQFSMLEACLIKRFKQSVKVRLELVLGAVDQFQSEL